MVKFLPPIFTNFKNYDHIIQTLLLNIKINMKDTAKIFSTSFCIRASMMSCKWALPTIF